MKKSKLASVLNKIAAQTPEKREPEVLPESPSEPPAPDAYIGVCCRAGYNCEYVYTAEEMQRCEEDGSANFVHGGSCPDSCGDDYDSGVCVNCATEQCSFIQDCSDFEQIDDCVRSGGNPYCAVDFDDFVVPHCSELLNKCYGDPGSKPGACCMVATQPAPAFYLGCINVENAQQCSDMEIGSGGLINTTFQEGKRCGERGPGSHDKEDADCPLAFDEYFKPTGACCKRCYTTDEYGILTLKSTSCFHTREGKCLMGNYEDEHGNPGQYHPDHVTGSDFCSYSWGGKDSVCQGAIGHPDGYPDGIPEDNPAFRDVKISDCKGTWDRKHDDPYDEGHPYPWIE